MKSNDMERQIIDTGFKRLAEKFHPDKGGDNAQMVALNAARDRLVKMLAEPPARPFYRQPVNVQGTAAPHPQQNTSTAGPRPIIDEQGARVIVDFVGEFIPNVIHEIFGVPRPRPARPPQNPRRPNPARIK